MISLLIKNILLDNIWCFLCVGRVGVTSSIEHNWVYYLNLAVFESIRFYYFLDISKYAFCLYSKKPMSLLKYIWVLTRYNLNLSFSVKLGIFSLYIHSKKIFMTYVTILYVTVKITILNFETDFILMKKSLIC